MNTEMLLMGYKVCTCNLRSLQNQLSVQAHYNSMHVPYGDRI